MRKMYINGVLENPMVMFAGDIDENVDFFFGEAERFPLLSAEQEQTIDQQKWDFAHQALLQLVKDPDGKRYVTEVCCAMLEQPADIEQFAQRNHYFTLKRDLKAIANSKAWLTPTQALIQAIQTDAPETEVLRRIEASQWPATFMIALAIVAERACGRKRKDTLADALTIWNANWQTWGFQRGADLRRDLMPPVQGYLAARDKLVMHNIRLVYKLSRENQNRGIAVRDLVQEGIIGLVRAAEKFDYRLGFRFSTYAYNWTNQHIQRVCEGNGSLVTYPTHVTQEVNALYRVRNEWIDKQGEEPSIAELAEQSGFSLDRVRELTQLTNLTVSIESDDDDDASALPESALVDEAANPALEQAQSRSLQRLVERQLKQLDRREQFIVTARWGLDGRPSRTLAQLADQLEVSRELVRQLEKSALRKLQVDSQLNEAFKVLSA